MTSLVQKEISYGRRHSPKKARDFQKSKPKLFEIKGARVVRYPNFYHFEDPSTTLGDILLVPGFPGLQNLQVLAETLQDYGFSVYIPVYPGIGQTYSGLKIKPEGEFSFTESQEQVNALFSVVRDNSLSRLVLGSYSIGAVLATNLMEKFPNSIDRVFTIGGTFHSQRLFHDIRGLRSLERYIHACCERGKVPIQGNSDRIFKDMIEFLEKSSNPEEVLSKGKMPLAVLHSPEDVEVPFSYVSRFFPKKATVIQYRITHMMHHIQDGDAGDDVAAIFYRFLKGDYDVRQGFRNALKATKRSLFDQQAVYEKPTIWTYGPGPYDEEHIPTRRMRFVDAVDFKRTF